MFNFKYEIIYCTFITNLGMLILVHNSFRLRVHSHPPKAKAKAQKIKEPVREIKEKISNIKEIFCRFSLSLGVNDP